MSIELITIIFIVSTLLLLLTGLPIAFVLGTVSMVMALWQWGPGAMEMMYYSITGLLGWLSIVAIPMFIFMGIVLEKSGVADDLYDAIYKWAGPINGGLSIGSILIGTLMAAMVGDSAAATVTLGLIALPSMLKRNYDKKMITGGIQAGAALGFLIPPSALMILYALIARTSVGKLFAAGIIPGLLMSVCFMIYIGLICWMKPELGPAIPVHERCTLKEKVVSLKGLILPSLLIFAALGLIFIGIASPTEAAAIAAIGSLVCAALHKRLSIKLVVDASYESMKLLGFLGFLIIGGITFAKVYDGLGASTLIEELLLSLDFGPLGILIIMQLCWFLLGMFMDDVVILLITGPIFLPIALSLGFDPTWFGIVFIINCQTSLLTPPYGFNLFLMKAVCPPEIRMIDIYQSVIPFVLIQLFVLILVIIFPQLALWIPSQLF